MSVISQSACSCCFDGDMQFPTFAECWHKNPPAHMFPDQTKMKRGSFKICFVGVLGVTEHDLPRIKNIIHKHNPSLRTHDVVTCIELGVDQSKKLFDFDENDKVTVVKDVLRQALVNRRGVLRHGNIDGSQIQMVGVLEKDIRQVTRGSLVEVINNNSPLYKYTGIARDDGRLDGWCCVTINSKLYTIPTMWVKTIRAQAPQDSGWENEAHVDILFEQVVPTHLANTRLDFNADGILDVAGLIQMFDPDCTVTPKIFAAFDTSMGDWSDQGQKDVVVDSICEQHASNPLNYFGKEYISPKTFVYFNWKGCSGTQSVFQCKGAPRFYVDNTNPDIRSQALIGWYSCALGEVQWELEHHRQIDKFEQITQRDESLMVENSFVAHRYDNTRRGKILRCMDSTRTCLVQWDQEIGAIPVPDSTPVEEAFANLERHVLTQQVVMTPGLMWGFVEDYEMNPRPAYVYVTFKGDTTISDAIGGAWFALEQLNRHRLQYQLQEYLSYPWRTARFFVQERVGESIRSIANGHSKLITNTSYALYNLRQAMAFFCKGAARMHRENISHNDLHIGNLTVTQNTEGEFFSVKMIDFDRMRKHAPKTPTRRFHKDLRNIVSGLDILLQNVKYLSLYPCVRGNHFAGVGALLDWFYTIHNDVGNMSSVCTGSETADFMINMAACIIGTPPRKRPLSP